MSSPGAGAPALHRDRSLLLRRRECICPTTVFRCAHLDGDVVQAWRSEGGAFRRRGVRRQRPARSGSLRQPGLDVHRSRLRGGVGGADGTVEAHLDRTLDPTRLPRPSSRIPVTRDEWNRCYALPAKGRQLLPHRKRNEPRSGTAQLALRPIVRAVRPTWTDYAVRGYGLGRSAPFAFRQWPRVPRYRPCSVQSSVFCG